MCDRVCKGSGAPGRVPCPRGKPPASPQTSPLYFAGHLNGAADVPRLQAEVGVKVLVGGNGGRVCGAGCLLHRSLGGPGTRLSAGEAPARPRPVGPASQPPAPAPQSRLTPLWEECCWAIPRKDWNGVFPPKEKGWSP